jgi:hypothetical protein
VYFNSEIGRLVMTKKLFQLLTLLASLAMTGCGWDDSLYKAYVDPEAEMPVTLCPSVCVPLNSEDLKDKIDLNADGSCPVIMDRVIELAETVGGIRS